MNKLLISIMFILSFSSSAAIIESTITRTIADGSHDHLTNTSGNAGMGYWYSEITRAVALFEFDNNWIDEQIALSFENLYSPSGLIWGNDSLYDDAFDVYYFFQSDATISYSDYYNTSDLLGSFPLVGSEHYMGIASSLFTDALSNGQNYFGVVLSPTGANSGQLADEVVFGNFRLTSSAFPSQVPAPSALALLLIGVAAVSFRLRLQQH